MMRQLLAGEVIEGGGGKPARVRLVIPAGGSGARICGEEAS